MAAKGITEEEISVTVSTYRWGFVVAGAAAAIAGLLILFQPDLMGHVFSILIGLYALVSGAVFGYMTVRGGQAPPLARVARGLVALALVVGGIMILAFMNTATAVLVNVVGIALGILWILEGVVVLLVIRGKPLNQWALAYVVLAIAIGVVMLLTPVWGGWPVRWLLGLSLIGLGAAQITRGATASPRLVVNVETGD